MPILTIAISLKTQLVAVLTNRTNYSDWDNKIFVEYKRIVDEQRRSYNASVLYLTQLDSSNRLMSSKKVSSQRLSYCPEGNFTISNLLPST